MVVGKENINVTFPDGSVSGAKVSNGPPPPCGPVNLIVDVHEAKLKPVTFGNSKNLNVGDEIFSIGSNELVSNPMMAKIFGIKDVIPSTITNLRFPIADIIQSNVTIGHSFYGGPVVNAKGEVIGMNLATSSWNDIPRNLEFIVPSNTITKVIPSMIKTGTFEHPWIGISANNTNKGVYVTEVVPDRPADGANIQRGDIMQRIDNVSITGVDDILNYLDK